MKNSIYRRSFIKRSIVGAVAVGNLSLLTGLVSATDNSGCNKAGCTSDRGNKVQLCGAICTDGNGGTKSCEFWC